MARRTSSTRGFKRTASVLNERIRRAGESRGFAVSRLLTHWAEIAGPEIAAIAQPVNVGYGRGGFGATLTVLTTGAQAPMLEMQKETLREKVNAVYGYNAISRVRITQTAATGFAEGQAVFAAKPAAEPPEPDARTLAQAQESVRPIENDDLRAALERLGRNVLSKSKY
ncbi:DUF721 domain-containing protein [Sedimentitalea sp. HM32M-2]|uniref:DUF721 domain-containing protein n=1 Tax=Sedimentitalea sp. HM32M-2 TaxID=3351566 RepID=UPI0036366E05